MKSLEKYNKPSFVKNIKHGINRNINAKPLHIRGSKKMHKIK